MGQWHAADEYDGQVREITFRSLCNSPMCPPDTAMTEYQHAVLSPDKKIFVRLSVSLPSIFGSIDNVLAIYFSCLLSNSFKKFSLLLFLSYYLQMVPCLLKTDFNDFFL